MSPRRLRHVPRAAHLAVARSAVQLAGVSLLTAAALAACTYDPPPEATLVYPQLGVYLEGDQLRVEFTEPIDRATFAFAVWEAARDPEGPFAAAAPLLSECRPAAGPCGEVTATFDDDGRGALIQLSEDLMAAGRLLSLEVLPGLADADGNDTGVGRAFDLIFFPSGFSTGGGGGDVPFVPGVYMLTSHLEVSGIAVNLKLITDFVVRGDAVGLYGVIGKAMDDGSVQGDVSIDARMCAVGSLLSSGGAEFVFTEPITLAMEYAGIPFELEKVSVWGSPSIDPATGLPHLSGALVYERLCLFPDTLNTCLGKKGAASFAGFEAPYFEEGSFLPNTERLCDEVCADALVCGQDSGATPVLSCAAFCGD